MSTDTGPIEGIQWDGADNEDEDDAFLEKDKHYLSERWKAAVKQARGKMERDDYRILQTFDSGDALLEDLERRNLTAGRDPRSPAIHCIRPFVETTKSTAKIFLMAMAPNPLELAILWGLVYLTITLSLKRNDRWDNFVERLEAIRKNLAQLNFCTKKKDIPRKEISNVIFDVFTTLIDIWVGAIKWIRSNQIDPRLCLEEEFRKSMDQVESSIKHLRSLASLDRNDRSAIREEQVVRHANMFSSPPGYDDDVVKRQIVMLPQARNSTSFFGREDVLSEIEAVLEDPDVSSNLNRRSVLLFGMGGVGKTQTAINYAYTTREHYDVIFWIKSESPLSLNSSMIEIARYLSFPTSDTPEKDEINLSNFHKWLRQQSARKTGCRWLLIYDNVKEIDDSINRFMPTTPGSIIITSRNRRAVLPESKVIHLKPFSNEFSGQLLRKLLKYPDQQLRGESDNQATTALAKTVRGLPLGIRLLAGLMNERGEDQAAEFLAMYKEYPRQLMMGAGPAVDYEREVSQSDNEEHPLDRVWTTVSFKSLQLPQRTLLGIISFLNPDEIPKSLFGKDAANGATVKKLGLVCGTIELDKSLVSLANMALVDCRSDPFTIHPLIQEAFRYWCDEEEASQHLTAAVHVVHQAFPRRVAGRPMHDCWDQCRKFIQHGRTLADRFMELRQRWSEFDATPDLAELLKGCAWYLYEMEEYHSAIRTVEIALTACPDKKSEVYAHLLNTIGACHFDLCDLTRCRKVWEQALDIREAWAKQKLFGAEEELANALNNYGNLQSAEGQYDSALRYFERAKIIRRRLGNEIIIPLGITYMTTGRALFLMEKYDEALVEYKEAAKIFIDKDKAGEEGHLMAHLNYAHGNLEMSRQDKAAAEKFYDKAKDILEKHTPLHLLLASCYYKLACLRDLESKREEALSLLDKGLNIAEFREGRGDAARIIRKKAAVLQAGSKKEQDRAKLLMRQVHDMVLQHRPNGVIVPDGEGDENWDWDSWVCPFWR